MLPFIYSMHDGVNPYRFLSFRVIAKITYSVFCDGYLPTLEPNLAAIIEHSDAIDPVTQHVHPHHSTD